MSYQYRDSRYKVDDYDFYDYHDDDDDDDNDDLMMHMHTEFCALCIV